MTREEVLKLYETFEYIRSFNADTNSKTIDVMFMFEKFGITFVKLPKMLVTTIKPASKKYLQFSEYVQLVCAWCMLSNKELIRFVFGHLDVEEKSLISYVF